VQSLDELLSRWRDEEETERNNPVLFGVEFEGHQNLDSLLDNLVDIEREIVFGQKSNSNRGIAQG
jgi:hypothetical protein